jgi:hypothetical protein
LRFIPEIKAKYDYGVTIFILTFSLVAVSSYRVEELIQLAHDRFYTIVVGVVICLLTTVFVFPVWAGEGVHKLAFGNLDKLAQFFEGTYLTISVPSSKFVRPQVNTCSHMHSNIP